MGGATWMPLAEEQAVLRRIRDMRSDGMKLHQIARVAEWAGIAARRNGTWRMQSVSILLRRRNRASSPDAKNGL